MSLNNTKYFYLVTEPPKNVVMSQIVEFAEFFGKNGLDFKAIFILSFKEYIKNRKQLKASQKHIAELLRETPEMYAGFFSKNWFGILMSSILMALRLKLENHNSRLVFHSRGGFSSNILAKVKKINRRIEFIYDVRGDNIAEFDYLSRQTNMPDEKRMRILGKIAESEKQIMQDASHMFCVSNVLKSKLTGDYDIRQEKITVVPCLADPSRFSYNPVLRRKMRKQLKLEAKFALVYPGGIGRWHSTEQVFRLTAEVLNSNDDVFFIILTPDLEAAAVYAERLLPAGRYMIRSAARSEMPGYLMAADMGLLLREDHPLNEVASPTKFAEYMIAGLPVMISENIGDYSAFVRLNKTGIVINDLKDKAEYLQKFAEFRAGCASLKREEISVKGHQNFSKTKYLPVMKQIYLSVAG
ncbi:MAG: hypothetical protein ACM3SM_09510 [Bacteroidota bacterium]